ncbi:MoxR family ATPase [Nonomuraea antimicrobica]|uniref:MoxR family ATPase n=1 Tax=Nonomuraea antimicrobica TaxID=561173 RepID=A0ABP7CEI8_9ACTN
MDALSVAVAANLPVILWGSPGTGKTSAVLALGERLGLPVEAVVGSIREPSDFAGLPVLREGRTWFAPPRWAERLASSGTGILFLDELTTAPPAVQAAMLRVVLERAVGDLVLPASVRIVAAANPPEQAADGWDLSAPLANRLIHLDWKVSAASVAEGFTTGFTAPSLAGWDPAAIAAVTGGGDGRGDGRGACGDSRAGGGGRGGTGAEGRARALVGAFLRVRPELVLAVPDGPARAWPSPRTWELAAKALARTSDPALAPGAYGAVGADGERVRAELVVGAVGEAAGFELLSWLRDLDLPDPETLLADPTAPLPDRVDRVHAVLGSVVAYVTADGSADTWQRAWTLIGRVAGRTPDVAAGAARSLAARRPHGAALPTTVLDLAPILRAAGLMP